MSDTSGPDEHRPSIRRLTRDLVAASTTLSDQEARFLVDAYYIAQEHRKRSANQTREMEAEPHTLIAWLAEQSENLENQIKRALDSYSDADPVGRWMRSIYGIGPVIAAGLLAHIDIERAPTVGHIWRFAGYDPTRKWEKKRKRPWNPALKTLCWKVGQSFMKFSGVEECIYGKVVYRERKAYEIQRNERGGNAERAAAILEARKYDKETEAYKAYIIGKLPAGQIDAQARRYTVKLFLSHLHLVWFFQEYKTLPPKPYAIGHLDHAHFIAPPNIDLIDGLGEAMKDARF